MAHTEGTSPRLQRLTSLVATMLVAAAVALAFGRVFLEADSTLRLLAMGLGSAVIAWAFERRNLLLATGVSAALLIVGLGLVVFPETTWYGLPTMETLREMGSAAAAVGEQARIQVAPTPPIAPLVFAGATAVWAAVFSCHALAFRAGSPLLALVPPVALVAFADSVLEHESRPLYGTAFLIAAIAVVFADSLRRLHGWGAVWQGKGHRDRLLPAAGRGARRIGGAAIAVALVAPLIVPGFGSKAVIDLSSLNADGRIAVSPLVSIGATLTQGEDVPVLKVTPSDPEERSYYRMTALEVFDGVSWQQLEAPTVPVGSGDALQPSPGGEILIQNVEVLSDLAFPWFPAAYMPTKLTAETTLSFDPRTSAILTEDPLEKGDRYEAVSYYLTPSPEDLDGAGAIDASVDPQLTLLPEDMPPRITEIAEQWTVNADTDFEKVLAIQDILSDEAQFDYETSPEIVDLRDDPDALVAFLDVTRTGFCQQFASAMAVLLRSIGIPARVVIGFTPGESDARGNYVVTTQDLHAWVEVPFEGYGYLPFEPTPTRVNPAANTYLHPPPVSSSDICLTEKMAGKPVCDPNHTRRTGDPGRPTTIPSPDPGSGATTSPDEAIPWARWGMIAAIAAIILALIAVPVVRALTRRRRVHRAHDPRQLVLATYDVFTQQASELGFPRRDAETPSEYRVRVLSAVGAPADPLDRLTDLAQVAAYSTAEPSPDDALDATADAHGVIEAMRDRIPWHQRIRGIYLPRRPD